MKVKQAFKNLNIKKKFKKTVYIVPSKTTSLGMILISSDFY